MNAGALRERITIQKRTISKVKGVPTDNWNTFYNCYCSINSLFGNELYKALEVQQENVLNFTIRYLKNLKYLNTKDYRIIWDKKMVDKKQIINGVETNIQVEEDRIFNIIAIDYFGFNKEKITIKAKEVI